MVVSVGLVGCESRDWLGACAFTDEATQSQRIDVWYKEVWDKAFEIDEMALFAAEKEWQARRHDQPTSKGNIRFINAPSEELKDRHICLAVYWENTTEVADAALAEVQQKFKLTEQQRRQAFNCFEDWPDWQENSLSIDGTIIILYYGNGGAVRVQNAWRRIPSLDKPKIKMLQRENAVSDWSFSSTVQKSSQSIFVLGWKVLKKKMPTRMVHCVALNDFLGWRRNNDLSSGS